MGKQAVDADLVIKDLWMGGAPRPGIKGPWKHLALSNKSFVKLINRVGKSMGSSHAATMIA